MRARQRCSRHPASAKGDVHGRSPAALDIAPVLAPLTALGLEAIMAGAAITRLRRREAMYTVADLAYLALAGFVARGRFGPAPFTG